MFIDQAAPNGTRPKSPAGVKPATSLSGLLVHASIPCIGPTHEDPSVSVLAQVVGFRSRLLINIGQFLLPRNRPPSRGGIRAGGLRFKSQKPRCVSYGRWRASATNRCSHAEAAGSFKLLARERERESSIQCEGAAELHPMVPTLGQSALVNFRASGFSSRMIPVFFEAARVSRGVY